MFAYGSLIWKPGFDHDCALQARAYGWRRSFCLDIEDWRATPDKPGLMLALRSGGSCVGMAYRLPADDPMGRMLRLLNREIGYRQDINWLRWLPVRADGRKIRALTFYCAPAADPYNLSLPLDEQSQRLATAVGHIGSCAEYLRNTALHLEDLGIRDKYIWQMQHMVAQRISATL